MPSSTLQTQSKRQRLADLGHAITNSARSQRFFGASKTKAIWKNSLNKAHRQWKQVRKNKRSTRRETVFDSMYPVGHISSPIPQYLMQNYTPQPSPRPPHVESNRDSTAPSVTLTTPTPSNSQKDQCKRQSQYTIHQVAGSSPMFSGRAQDRRTGVIFPHPLACVVASSPDTPYTARTSSDYDVGSDVGSGEWSTRLTVRSKYTLSDYSSGNSTPNTAHFPGQVNLGEIARKRQSEDLTILSHDILDGHRPSDRDQLFSQRGRTAQEVTLPLRPASVPPQTPSLLKPNNASTQPVTTYFEPGSLSPVQESPNNSPRRGNFKQGPALPIIPYPGESLGGVRKSIYAIAGIPEEPQQSGTHDDAAVVSSARESPISTPLHDGFQQGPQLPPLAYPGTSAMEGVRNSIMSISGHDEEPQQSVTHHDTTLAMLEGKLPPIREPSQVADSEAAVHTTRDRNAYPGSTPYRSTRYESYHPDKKLKGRPVPAVGMGRSRPTTPATPQRSSKVKQAADADVQKNLAKARADVRRKHKTLSMMLDGGILTTPAPINERGSWTTDDRSEYSSSGERTPLQSSAIIRKPVPKQPSQKISNTGKPLPKLPPPTRTSSRSHQQPQPATPESSSRITVLEQRIAALETQLARKTPVSAAAAGARAAAALHSAMSAGYSIPRGPHRARPSKKSDIHHEQTQAPTKQPSAGSILRDVVGLTKGRFF